MRERQIALLCGCGEAEIYRAGCCRRCHRRARLSRERFAGMREYVLRRDDFQCQVCGCREALVVHHRPAGFLTLCSGCHARIHRTYRPKFSWAGLLRRLWREANPDLAEQRLLALLGERRAAEYQAGLFEPADGGAGTV